MATNIFFSLSFLISTFIIYSPLFNCLCDSHLYHSKSGTSIQFADKAFGSSTRICFFAILTDGLNPYKTIGKNSDTGELVGFYVLNPELPTILPYRPEIEYGADPDISNNDISSWRLIFTNDDDSPTELPYETFIARLPEEKYRFIDAAYILLEAFTKDELAQLAIE